MVQALNLQKWAIVPDKFISVKTKKAIAITRIKQYCVSVNQTLYGPELDDLAERMWNEHCVHSASVDKCFGEFSFTYDCSTRAQNDAAGDLAQMLRVRFRQNAPRRPPKIVMLGPTGSGRSTQAERTASSFGLVNVSPQLLVEEESRKNPAVRIQVKEALEAGEDLPEEIVLRLVRERITKSDCRINGWVLDGFPQTETQVNMLKSIKIVPSLVCLFEQTEEESINRLSARRVDPQTGEYFNMDIN